MNIAKLQRLQEKENVSKPVQLVSLIVIISFSACVAWLIPVSGGIDFSGCFYPVGNALLHGESPYSNPCFYNPPWLAVLFAPFALLQMDLAWRLWMSLSLIGLVLSLHRLHFSMTGIAALALSPFLLINVFYSNIDWMVLLGATLPPSLGIWLVALKPQLGAPVILLWGWKAYRRGGVPGVVRLLAPVGLALLVCLALGWYRLPDPRLYSSSADIFPFGIPLGLLLLGLALRHREVIFALSAGPFLSPYLAVFSWLPAALPAARSRRGSFLLVPVSWLCLFLWRTFVLE